MPRTESFARAHFRRISPRGRRLLYGACLLALLEPGQALAAPDVSATVVVKNEVDRTYRVTLTPSTGDPQTVSLAQGARKILEVAPGPSCQDETVEIEMRFVNGPVNRVDARATVPLVAVQGPPDDSGVASCTLEVRKPTEVYERTYDNYFTWTKINASSGRVTFAIRYGI
jgi:hypothetical protein